MKGKIVLIPFPFTDLTMTKLRPALVLYEGERDIVVAFISSQIRAGMSNVGVVIKESHPQFNMTGLKMTSIVRLDKLATLLKNLVVGEIGSLSQDLRILINKKFKEIYTLT